MTTQRERNAKIITSALRIVSILFVFASALALGQTLSPDPSHALASLQNLLQPDKNFINAIGRRKVELTLNFPPLGDSKNFVFAAPVGSKQWSVIQWPRIVQFTLTDIDVKSIDLSYTRTRAEEDAEQKKYPTLLFRTIYKKETIMPMKLVKQKDGSIVSELATGTGFPSTLIIFKSEDRAKAFADEFARIVSACSTTAVQ